MSGYCAYLSTCCLCQSLAMQPYELPSCPRSQPSSRPSSRPSSCPTSHALYTLVCWRYLLFLGIQQRLDHRRRTQPAQLPLSARQPRRPPPPHPSRPLARLQQLRPRRPRRRRRGAGRRRGRRRQCGPQHGLIQQPGVGQLGGHEARHAARTKQRRILVQRPHRIAHLGGRRLSPCVVRKT